jgi:hypothetical protein
MSRGRSLKQVDRRTFLKGAVAAVPGLAANTAPGFRQNPGSIPDRWDRETDVVVLGTGFAGLSAAITVKDAGSRVLILEKMPQKHEGGNSWFGDYEPSRDNLKEIEKGWIVKGNTVAEPGSFWGWMYNGGDSNAEALCTGQIAGRNAAAEKQYSAA